MSYSHNLSIVIFSIKLSRTEKVLDTVKKLKYLS